MRAQLLPDPCAQRGDELVRVDAHVKLGRVRAADERHSNTHRRAADGRAVPTCAHARLIGGLLRLDLLDKEA